MTFIRQFLHVKAYFSDQKYVSMSPKKSNLHAKIDQNWQIALFTYFCLSELFATVNIKLPQKILVCRLETNYGSGLVVEFIRRSFELRPPLRHENSG